jgi:trk system potassium uptake protein TrkA
MSLIRPTEGNSPGGTDGATCYVLGGGHVAAAIAGRLRTDDRPVSVVSESYEPSEPPGLRGDPTDARVLDAAGVAGASTVVVATRSDRRNLLIAQLVRTRFDVPRVVVLVNAPERLEPLAEAGHEPVCATSALADVLTERV